ncbi:MAG: helix-turn-helix transcriptional regulator [Armatimonadota bacterium]
MIRRFCHRHGPGGYPCSCSMGRLSRLIEPVVVLAIRNRPGTYGYHLMSEIERLAMTDSELDAGAVYRTLRQLEAMGMVTSTWDTSGGGPARRCYTLTDEGRRHLDDWAALIRKRRAEMDRFLEAYAAEA